MRKTTVGIVAGMIGSALSALWWTKRRAASRDAEARRLRASAIVADYDELADGII